ncbi:polysaccharide biosynthesis protein [Enterococcus faecalis]|nr:polysaccharide biosynthesis protein [Enterococcus faecalis]
MKKICFTSSSGGHLEELLKLKNLMDQHNSIILTEHTPYKIETEYKTYYLRQINRCESFFMGHILVNFFKSLKVLLLEKPDFILSTGALATVPICCLGKLLGIKVIYIESFAKVNSKTRTGQLMYHIADQFYVQWESMLKLYPNAIYKGALF